MVSEIDKALGLWRTSRSPVDAARLEELDVAARRAFAAPRARTKEAFHAAWLEVASKDPSATATGWLASTLAERLAVAADYFGLLRPGYALEKYAAILERVAAIRARNADPRVARALLTLVETAPYSVMDPAGNDSIYEPILEALVASGDPSVVPALERLLSHPRATKASLRACLARLVPAALDALRRIPVAHQDPVAAPAAIVKPPTMDGAELLARVLEAPDDDAARYVYADWLQERGDPRGELIALQMLGDEATDAQRKRARALVRQHKGAWLGPLAAVLRGVEFERGFLAVAELANNASATPEAWRAAYVDPRLATVRELHQGHGNAEHYRAFITSEVARSMARITIPQPSFLDQLLDDEAVYPFQHLRFGRPLRRKQLGSLAAARSLSNVSGLVVPLGSRREALGIPAALAELDAFVADLAATGLLPRIRALGVRFDYDARGLVAAVLAHVTALPPSIERLSVHGHATSEAAVTRSPTGNLVAITSYLVSEAASVLRAAPPDLVELRLDPEHLADSSLPPLAKACREAGIRLLHD